MNPPGYVTKGSRIHAEWFGDAKIVSLAGMGMKVEAGQIVVVGTVRHIRGDDPVAPKTIRFYVDPEHEWTGPTMRPTGCTCDHEHVEVNPDHVKAVDAPPKAGPPPADCRLKMSHYGTCSKGTRGCIAKHKGV
jgi:hypothetical protein